MTDYVGAIEKFRKEQCTGYAMTQGTAQGTAQGKITYKGMPIKKDMIEHIFPEIHFKDGPCDPCSESCKFSIIEQKLRTENQMIPISRMK
jgi:hypothetical protein